MPEPKRVGLYVRVSTSEQSTDLQLRELHAFAQARGWTVAQVYDDSGFSGTTGNRPALKALLRDARARRLDVVITWKLDRLFRSLRDLVSTLQEFSDLGVEFVSLRDAIDLTTASGRLMTHMLGAFAEFEAGLIRERVRAGVAAARARGTRLGRPPTAPLDAIRELRAAGKSFREISSLLGVGSGSIQRAVATSDVRPHPSPYPTRDRRSQGKRARRCGESS